MGIEGIFSTVRERVTRVREWALSNPRGLQRSFEALGVLLFLALVLVFALRPIRTFDPWWHLATGKWIFAHHQIPKMDPFSHTCTSCRWIDLCWLFQVLAFLAYKAGGPWGLWALKVAIITLTMAIFYLLLRRRCGNPYIAVLLGMLTVVIVQMRFMARPHILGFLCLVLFTEAADLWASRGRWWALGAAILLYLIWLNSHGSFLVAFAVAGALFLGDAWDDLGLHMRELVKKDWLHRHLALMLSLLLVSCITPYGFQMLVFAITSHLGKGADATRNIAEWHPMRWKEIFTLIPGTRESARGILFLLSAFCIPLGFKRDKRATVALAALLPFSLFLALKHSRFVAIDALLLIPWVAVVLSKAGLKTKAIIGIIIAFYLLPLSWKAFEIPKVTNDYGKAVASFYPWDITEFVKEKGIKGNLMNEYGMGGFLIWRLYPNCRVYIDGRTPTVYSPFHFWLYRQTDKVKQVFWNEIGRTRVNVAIVRKGSNTSKWLWGNSTWCLADMDDERALYVDNLTAGKTGTGCFKHLKPFASVDSLLKKGNATTAIKNELERLKAISPHSVYPYKGLADLFEKNHQREKALAEIEKAINLKPKSVSLHFRLGKMFEIYNNTEKATKEMETVLKLNPKAAPAMKELGILCYNATKYQDSVSYLTKYLDMVGDANMRTYAYLGLAQYKLFDVEEALDSFTKAVVLCPKKSLKKIYYNYIGNCLWGLKRYKEAINSYRLALSIDPNYQDARENLRTLVGMLRGKRPVQWKPRSSQRLEKELSTREKE